ncbi:hypothetical protein AM493_18655 [Flavobacterium akiainvivens]|uniref:Uncharacterized protein n=1 Tax=Flavobacterium akiainvivens TaxID=1202724 RepID=A0A0M9VJK0_9FLAO|nr:hypothetical protein [Flavobacterium akiainvivens]KOS07852.1 hypothetical protein AM493_18655 [Flavobacterium akiainvivens]SFQ27555.1 hypothetical protein SAMN05444144_102312 [Flavobacterium akiainvivens]
MKKSLLSLFALFAVSIASAQSYIKQPDPTTYEVVNAKPAPQPETTTTTTQTQPEAPAPEKAPEATTQADTKEAAPQKTEQPATMPKEAAQPRSRK